MIQPKSHFLSAMDMHEDKLIKTVQTALQGSDDGELFMEVSQNQGLSFEDGRVKTTSFAESQGMGLRRIDGEFAGLVHSNNLSEFQLKKAAKELAAVSSGHSALHNMDMPQHHNPLYPAINPVQSHKLEERIKLMGDIDKYLRHKDNRVVQVIVRFNTNMQQIMVVRPDGELSTDVRPLVRMDVSVILDNGKVRESGHYGYGTRDNDDLFFSETDWKYAADEAYRRAEVALEAMPSPAGEIPVVMAPGWSGVLFHEAVGHGLEGDFNRKGTSAFTGLVGQQVAAKGVTVIDDGSIPGRRGSLTIDDEGTPTQRNVLIEDGILKGYMQDRLNARLMGVKPTGNGRRESYADLPLPRMTNTFLLGGNDTPEEIVADTKYGLFAKSFGGGQVDITSGSFVFEVSEAYLIENGKITTPVKDATLIGNGPNTLKYIDRIGNNMALDPGIGTCGKDGQGVPVGVGQPTLRLNGGITVGGTE